MNSLYPDLYFFISSMSQIHSRKLLSENLFASPLLPVTNFVCTVFMKRKSRRHVCKLDEFSLPRALRNLPVVLVLFGLMLPRNWLLKKWVVESRFL